MLFTEINQLELLGRIATGDFTQEEADLNDSSVTTVALVFLVVLSTTGVCFCAWFARCNRNARALGAEAMQFGPRAWGWFFCPILNLWKPYQAVTELFVSSQDVRRAIMPTAVFTAWWAAWITSGISGRVSTKMMESDAIGTVTAGAWLGALSSVAILAAGFFCIHVVSSIQNEQNLRIEP
ncbi:MAG: DUF4328 domain-containing protein [Nannocystaceae bacterium]|nr:DUF4328 domain-containing protein [Nannocystaceae bacterium]